VRKKSSRRHLRSGPPRAGLGGAGIKLVYTMIAGLLASNVAMGLALYWSPEIAGLMDRQQTHDVSAYEDRIAQLRLEVDRLHSRQYARAGDINLQLQDLVQQQDLLSEQQQYVRTLADMARQLGLETAPDPGPEAALLAIPSATGDDPIGDIAGQIERMQTETLGALAALSDAAEQSTREILSEMNRIGLDPELEINAAALGGPFEPAFDDPAASAHIVAANAVMEALARYQLARDAVLEAPVHRPLLGALSISSGYGNRTDPFNGRTAYHSGIDFRAASGTDILAAGAGKVVFAGRNSGYGNMIDIEHADGIVTRYGHLSRIEVRVGQTVDVGEVIGLVGSTGRSTGPHLHFEVRRNDQAVDPGAFLSAGRRLAELI
jgi:murein DD-endopeptidase MepM/ murein hydrolase activator NlpD